MRARQFITEAEQAVKKKLGRAFNHLEDLVFFYGTEGTIEALEHIKEIASQEGSKTVRMKWDGNPQIYWGREIANGPLILAGHNGWTRGMKTDNPDDLKDFIANKSGNPKTPEEKQQRELFAGKFASLYPLFDAATPKDFIGYVYADALFLERPEIDDNGVYNFCPNPKSQTCYHVSADSDLGKRIANSSVMVVGHAYFPEFSMPDDDQKPMDDFDMFNKTAELIVMGPVYSEVTPTIDINQIDQIEKNLQANSIDIDNFLQGAPGLADLKNIVYTYVNNAAKSNQLDSLSENSFMTWLDSSNRVSVPKKEKIKELATQYPKALSGIFNLVSDIMSVKDVIIDQLEQQRGEIWDTKGEGRVRYGVGKKFGNVKLVPRKRWTPSRI